MLTKTFANAPLCRHVRLNNQPCGQPALKGRRFCRFHIAANLKRPDYSLPVVEDATSLQYAIMQVIRGLADKAIDHRTAALMLYGLQIACSNLKRFQQEQPDPEAKREESLAEMLLNGLEKHRQEMEEQQKSSENSPQQLGPDVPRLFGCVDPAFLHPRDNAVSSHRAPVCQDALPRKAKSKGASRLKAGERRSRFAGRKKAIASLNDVFEFLVSGVPTIRKVSRFASIRNSKLRLGHGGPSTSAAQSG